MRVLRSILLLLVIGAYLPAFSGRAAARECTGPDSFLKWRASSVDEFMAEYDRDPVLRKRLAKHFHVSEAELGSYFRTNLRVVTIRESGWVTVYGVNRSGRIYKTRDYLRRGAKVLGLPDGTPLLKLPCGNPLTNVLPPVKRAAQPKPLPVVSEVVEQPMVVTAPEVPPPLQAPEEFALLPAVPSAPLTPALAQPLAERSAFPWWLAAAPLPFLGDHERHRERPVPVVPEPSTLLCLAAGTALLGTWTRRRRAGR
jgi:hypothetical protein